MQGFRGLGQAAAEMPVPVSSSRSPVPVPPGDIVKYYSDLQSGLVAPEDMRIEDLQFRVQISPQGLVVFNTAPVMIVSRYNFALRKIIGWAMNPDLAGAAPALVNFNILEQGRNFSVYKNPVSLQSVVSRPGPGNIHSWDGVYITIPGTTLEVVWTVDSVRWPILVGAAREFGIQLLGDYVACSP